MLRGVAGWGWLLMLLSGTCFFLKPLGNGTAERLRLAVVELHPYCPELWGWEQERGTGQVTLPACIVVPGRVSQESSGSG